MSHKKQKTTGDSAPLTQVSQFSAASSTPMSQFTQADVESAVANAMAGQTLAMKGYQQNAPAYLANSNPVYRQQRDYTKRKVTVALPRRGPGGTLSKYGLTFASASELQKAQRLEDGYSGRGRYSRKVLRRKRPAQIKGGFTRMRGRGLYTSSELGRNVGYGGNVLIEGGRSAMQVGMGATDNQELVINHTEYLRDVYGPADATFTLSSTALNPGLLESFPYLAQIAANYEEYEFIQLMFHFKSTVDASISATGTTGTLIMATNYNPDADVLSSKKDMMQYHGSNATRLDKDMLHGVECDPAKNAGPAIRYTRNIAPKNGQNLKDFDLGLFQLALVDLPSQFFNQQVGELWVSYSVKLAKPKLGVSLGRTITEDRFISNGGESSTSILGTQLLKMKENNIGVVLSESSPSATNVHVKYTFPALKTGRYEIRFTSFNDSVSTGIGSVTGNVNLIADLWSGAAYQSYVSTGIGGNSCDTIVHIDVSPAPSGVENTITLLHGSVSTSQYTFHIRPYNPDIPVPPTWLTASTDSVIVPS